MNDPALPDLFDLKGAAAYTGRHPQTLRHHRYTTGLLTGRLLGHSLVFTRAELDEFLATVGPGGRQPMGQARETITDYRERQLRAYALWRKKLSYADIATELGYSSSRAAKRAVAAGQLIRKQAKR